MDRAGIAAVLSFFIPGLGQIYIGQWFKGLIWLIITPGMWISTGGTLGWICHFVSAYLAYKSAEHQRV